MGISTGRDGWKYAVDMNEDRDGAVWYTNENGGGDRVEK